MSKPCKKKRPPKRVLALPDLEQSKAAVLNTLTSKSGQRSFYRGHPCRWASPTFALSSGQSLEYHDRLLNSLSLVAQFGEHFVDVHVRSISSRLTPPWE